MRTGSFVKYKGNDKRYSGRYMVVHACKEDGIVVYTSRKPNGKWQTTTIPAKDVEVVVE